jgi:hypothetical protein
VPRRVGSAGRDWLAFERGVEAHLAYQREAMRSVASFEAEVVVRGERALGEWRVVLGGRCDGVRASDGALVVEELKHVTAGDARAWLREAASVQAQLYAWLLEPARGARVDAELVWLARDGGVRAREPAALGRDAVLAPPRRARRSWLAGARWQAPSRSRSRRCARVSARSSRRHSARSMRVSTCCSKRRPGSARPQQP